MKELSVTGAAGPGVVATVDQLRMFTDDWLANRNLSDHTRRAYRRDVRNWIAWCEATNLRPLAARFTHVNAYARELGQQLADRSVARALSAISSWYAFLVKLDAVPTNPAADADRPSIDRSETTTVGFTAAEARAMVAAATNDRWFGPECAAALANFMVDVGARVSEICQVDLDDLGYDSGHRTVRLRMKGRKTRQRSIPPALSHAVDVYLQARAAAAGCAVEALAGRLFVTRQGTPINPRAVFRFVRRIARTAEVPAAERLSPHSFRHAWATIAREAGASLESRQHALGHADPRTTQGYDRNRLSLDQDPSYLVAAAVAGA